MFCGSAGSRGSIEYLPILVVHEPTSRAAERLIVSHRERPGTGAGDSLTTKITFRVVSELFGDYDYDDDVWRHGETLSMLEFSNSGIASARF